MPSSTRRAFPFVALVALATAAACSSTKDEAQSCQSTSECSASARCVSGACVANGAPVASVAVPGGSLQASALLSFDGSASADPDPGDSIVSYGWAFRAVTAPCAPPVVAGSGPSAGVRFSCPGKYAVDLTVTDALNAHGVDTKEFEVGPYAGPALLAIGADVAVDHACAGSPLLCTPTAPVALSAVPTPQAPPGLSVSWTVEPPAGLPLDGTRRATFAPSASSQTPTVSIEGDGVAISGDWVFHAEAHDAAGLVASGAIRVSVGNRPPAVTVTMPRFDHTFTGSAFVMTAKILVAVADPDGDPLVGRSVTWNHVNDGGAYFAALDETDGVSVSLNVPYSTPSDAAFLIGGAGLARSVTFSVADVNGATVTDVWPIVVANRAPVLVSQASQWVDHAFDAASQAYVAAATVSTWSDPDGDPIFPAGPTTDPACASLSVSGGVASVSCSMAYTGTPAVGLFATTHAVGHQVTDPWASSSQVITYVAIGNRAPKLLVTTAAPTGLCHKGSCCEFDIDLGRCVMWAYAADAVSFDVASFAADDDGDPIQVLAAPQRGLATPQAQVCAPGACAFSVSDPGGTYVCGIPTTSLAVGLTLSDGGPDVTGQIAYGSCM